MRTPAHASILFRLGRKRVASVEPDPADLGTAFGLDLSLCQQQAAAGSESAEPPYWLAWVSPRPAG